MLIIGFTGCSGEPITGSSSRLRQYYTFEDILGLATDVVVAQYENSEQFGKQHTRHKFIANERVYGNAPDILYVYTEGANISAINADNDARSVAIDYNENDIKLCKGVNYMLVLYKADNILTT